MTENATYNRAKHLFSNDEFKAEFAKCLDNFIPKQGEKAQLVPMLVSVCNSYDDNVGHYHYDVHLIDHPDFDIYDTRATLLKNIGRNLAEQNKHLCAVFLLSEAWLSCQKIQPDKLPKYATAGEDPDKQEVFVLMGQTLDGRNAFVYSAFTTGADGMIATLETNDINADLDDIDDNKMIERFDRFPAISGLIKEYLIVMHARIMARYQ
jgi:hypothetical protein